MAHEEQAWESDGSPSTVCQQYLCRNAQICVAVVYVPSLSFVHMTSRFLACTVVGDQVSALFLNMVR